MDELQSWIKKVLSQIDGLRDLNTKLKGYLYEAAAEYRKKKHESKCESCRAKRMEAETRKIEINYQH